MVLDRTALSNRLVGFFKKKMLEDVFFPAFS